MNYGNNHRSDMGPKQNSCWNCSMTTHSLQNCPEPRNQRIINKNRHMFIMQKIEKQNSQPNNFQNFRNR